MIPPAANGATTWLVRWFLPDASATVLEADVVWRGSWPTGVILAALAGVGVLVIGVYRSRRLGLRPRWRWALGGLRAAALTLVLGVLLQPELAARLERREAKTLTLLLDRSESMSVRDGAEATPTSRWRRAVTTLHEASSRIETSNATAGDARDDGPRLEVFLFDEGIAPADATALPAECTHDSE